MNRLRLTSDRIIQDLFTFYTFICIFYQEIVFALFDARRRKFHAIENLLMKVNSHLFLLIVFFVCSTASDILILNYEQHLKWLCRRGFLMFLATQSYLPVASPPLADSMSR